MRIRVVVVAVTIATGLLVTGALAQHEQHNKDQAAPPAGQTDTGQAGGQPGGMTPGKMMAHMSQEMLDQNETRKLVDRLMTSFAAIETESDPAILRKELAEHGSLLKELQAKVQAQSHRMDMMQDMMSGGMMGSADKSGEHQH